MTPQEVDRIARTAVSQFCRTDEFHEAMSKAIKRTLIHVGIDAEDPIECQADFQHLRAARVAVREIRKKGILTLIGVAVTGGLATLWLGIKTILGQ